MSQKIEVDLSRVVGTSPVRLKEVEDYLKPCPFCGERPRMTARQGSWMFFHIYCKKGMWRSDGVEHIIEIEGTDLDDTVKKWNEAVGK